MRRQHHHRPTVVIIMYSRSIDNHVAFAFVPHLMLITSSASCFEREMINAVAAAATVSECGGSRVIVLHMYTTS